MKQENADHEIETMQAVHDTLQALKDAQPWLHDVHTVHTNGWLVVQIRTCRTSWGFVDHANIRTATSTDLTWAEKQRLKNEIFGEGRTALEVFPTTERLIDEAMMYHLWVLPAETALPFGIHRSDPCADKHYRP
jgi:hypothetical protein